MNKFKSKHISYVVEQFKTPKIMKTYLVNAINTGMNQYNLSSGEINFIKELSLYYSPRFKREFVLGNIISNKDINIFYDAIFYGLMKDNEEIISLGPVDAFIKEKAKFHDKRIVESKIKLINEKLQIDYENVASLMNDKTRFILVNDPSFNTG